MRVLGTGKYPPSCGKSSGSWSKSRCAQGGVGYSKSLKVKWGYISAQKLQSERLKSFAVSISLQTKVSRSLFKNPGTVKYHPSSEKSSRTWSKSRCVQGSLGYSMSLKVKWAYISAQKLKTEGSKSFPLSISLQTKAIRN